MSAPSSSGDDPAPKRRPVVLHAANKFAAKAMAAAKAPPAAPAEQVTGVASSRRKRRRKLAESFASGERTFGSGEDPEMMQAFIERGLRTGGAAGRAAVAELANEVSWGSPWPLRRDEFPSHVLQMLVEEGAEDGVRVEISVGATPCLSLAGPRDGEWNIVKMFWRCVSETAEIAGEGVIENLPIPPKWVEKVQQSAEGTQRVRVTRESRAGTFDRDERRAHARQLIRELAGVDSRAIRNPFDQSLLVEFMEVAWLSMKEAGAALLVSSEGSPILNPRGIRRCIAQVQGESRMPAIEELGSCDNALQAIGNHLRACDGPPCGRFWSERA